MQQCFYFRIKPLIDVIVCDSSGSDGVSFTLNFRITPFIKYKNNTLLAKLQLRNFFLTNVIFFKAGLESLSFNSLTKNQNAIIQERITLLTPEKKTVIIQNGFKYPTIENNSQVALKRPTDLSLPIKPITYIPETKRITSPSSRPGGVLSTHEDGSHASTLNGKSPQSFNSSSNESQKMNSDEVSIRSLASIGMGSTDGRRMVIRKVPQSPEQLLNFVNPPT